MLGWGVIAALTAALLGAVIAWLGRQQLVVSRWGRRVLVLMAALLPIAASAATFKVGVRESSRTQFCLSCHEMQNHGKSLFADNRKALSAVHYQNRLVDRDNTCYTCHTDYALFGDVKAKLNGLRHVWVHYLGTVPAQMKLYQPYPNHNCLHCHDDARRFVDAIPHQAVMPQLRSGDLSCLKCHAIGHDMNAVAQRQFWQAQ